MERLKIVNNTHAISRYNFHLYSSINLRVTIDVYDLDQQKEIISSDRYIIVKFHLQDSSNKKQNKTKQNKTKQKQK